jgi:hypothetical protein
MLSQKLYWMKNEAVLDLHLNIDANLNRYRNGDFSDLAARVEWQQKEFLVYNSDSFLKLSGNSSDDLEDALIVFSELSALPPRLATCLNIWVPLIHTSLLDYTKTRWLKLEGTDEQLKKSIQDHIFKGGIGGYRDDNSAGRPWWTGFVGSQMAGSKDVGIIRDTLKPFMRTTDTRSNVIERSGIFSERGLAKQISDYLNAGKLADSEDQDVFRGFMVSINLRSNGRYFGDMSATEVHGFLDTCR